MLIINEQKCRKDALCAADCPTTVIRMGDRGFPEMKEDGFCLACGHCVAVCPHGALGHKLIPEEGSDPIRADLALGEEQAVQFLRSRRSIRRFRDKPVAKDRIRRLIEIARYAPTGGNTQMVEWTVLDDARRIRSVASLTIDWLRQLIRDPKVVEASPYLPMAVAAWDAGVDAVLRGAPAVVVASAPREAMNGLVDVTIAQTYLDVMAPAMGLGTCWAGLLQGALLNSPAVKEAVGMPQAHPHHYPMMLGYPDVSYYRVPERKAPKIVFS